MKNSILDRNNQTEKKLKATISNNDDERNCGSKRHVSKKKILSTG